MIIDCIADLHGSYPKLEGGDLLIIAGDLTKSDSENEYKNEFSIWMHDQCILNYKKVIWIAGNHDNWIEQNVSPEKQLGFGEYLCDSGTEFEGLKIWGSPWTQTFPGINSKCKAFTVDTDEELAKKWELIPEDIDILITHSPPICIFDENILGDYCGSESLLYKATSLKNIKLFVFGRIHEGYGIFTPKQLEEFSENSRKIFGAPKCKSFPYIVNASHVNERYQPVNEHVRIIL